MAYIVFDSGPLPCAVTGGLGTLAFTNIRGIVDAIFVDAPSDSATYFIEILNADGNTVWMDQGTGDHPFKVDMILARGFSVRIRSASQDGSYIITLSANRAYQ